MEALKQHNDGQRHELDHEERAEPGGRHVGRQCTPVALDKDSPATRPVLPAGRGR